MYDYRVTILKVIDGDTVHAKVDLGLDVSLNITLRLAGIDAPEMSTAAGKEAKTVLEKMLNKTPLTLRTIKDKKEKYGRYLGLFSDKDGLDINAEMVSRGNATAYFGGTR